MTAQHYTLFPNQVTLTQGFCQQLDGLYELDVELFGLFIDVLKDKFVDVYQHAVTFTCFQVIDVLQLVKWLEISGVDAGAGGQGRGQIVVLAGH